VSSEFEALEVLLAYYKREMPVLYLFHPFVIRARRIKTNLKG
jgi:hypothetical protein